MFGNKTFFSGVKKFLSSGLDNIENVYTRYRPKLATILDNLLKNKLPTNDFPFVENHGGRSKVLEHVTVFIVGGVTYQEAALVAQINKARSFNILLGGSCIHNSTSYIDDVLGLATTPSEALGAAEAATDEIALDVNE